jgi:hypothetical protein
MRVLKAAGACLLAGVIAVAAAAPALAQTAPPRDGAHDFDFNIGVWRTHIRRIKDPLSGSDAGYEMNGTVTVRPVWGGRAELEEIEGDGPSGHWQGMTLFLYDPSAHQWSQTFIGADSGTLNAPTIGSFANGRGELFATDTVKGRAVLLRGVWSNIEPDSHDYVESFSDDGGKTWSASFIAHLTRVSQ